ncbi:MAG: hypothetical protein LBH11_00215 [Propionibacteriaceae bacterium]|nr:hypothetical protein [Propionibacteriaceae bacterium]
MSAVLIAVLGLSLAGVSASGGPVDRNKVNANVPMITLLGGDPALGAVDESVLAAVPSPLATQQWLAVAVAVKAGASGSATNPVTDSLINGGFSTTYLVQPGASQHTVPIMNYQVADGSPTTAAFRFYGPNDTSITEGEMLGYAFTTVRIGASYAYRTSDDMQADWDAGSDVPLADCVIAPTTAGCHLSAVYARVNGGEWQPLNETRTFTVLADSAMYLNIEYTSARPGVDPDPFSQDASTANYDAAADPFVGAFFTPGAIEAEVRFDKWVPTYQRPEISRIDTMVTVSGVPGDDITLLQADADASVIVPVADRPAIAVGMGCTDVRCDPAATPDPEQRKFLPNDEARFTISASNEANGALAYEHPVLIAYLEPDTFSMAHDDSGEPIHAVYIVDSAGNRRPYAGTVNYKEYGSVGIWGLPDLALAATEKVQVDFTVVIAGVWIDAQPTNFAYATSGKLPLLPSDKYPTGAAIDGISGCFPVSDFQHCGDRVYDQDAPGAYPDIASWRAEDWARLTALGSFNPQDYGLFVRAETDSFGISPSGVVNRGIFLKINDGPFTATATPQQINFGDEVTFRLAVQNDQAAAVSPVNSITNIRFVNVLPYLGDDRDTAWSDELRDIWRYQDGSLRVYTLADGDLAPEVYTVSSESSDPLGVDATIAGWLRGTLTGTAGMSADATSFFVNLGDAVAEGAAVAGSGFLLPPGGVLYLEYTMKLADWQDGYADLLAGDAVKTAFNDFQMNFQSVTSAGTLSEDIFLESNVVALREWGRGFIARGRVWEDTSFNGIREDDEIGIPGIPMRLSQRLPGETVWTPTPQPDGVTFPTETDANGKYSFEELPFYEGSILIDYRVCFGFPETGDWMFTEHRVNGYGLAGFDPRESWVYQTTDGDNVAGCSDTRSFVYDSEYALNVINAGMYQLGSLGGVIWEDLNGNGVRDDADAPWPHNVTDTTVTLTGTNTSGIFVQQTVAADAATGAFNFAGLKTAADPGYTVTFDRSAVRDADVHFKWAPTGQGTAATDSDADYGSDPFAAGATAVVAFPYGSVIDDLDAGVVPYFHIGGFVWYDENRDGECQDSERLMPGVEVRLWRREPAPDGHSESLVGSTTTDRQGRYLFDELLYEPGVEYKAVFVNPNPEHRMFTVAGRDNTAVHPVKSATDGGHLEAHTEYLVGAVAHSDDELNAGMHGIDFEVRVPTGGSVSRAAPGMFRPMLAAGIVVVLFGAAWYGKRSGG